MHDAQGEMKTQLHEKNDQNSEQGPVEPEFEYYVSNYSTAYSDAYKQQPFAAREMIKPSTKFSLNGSKDTRFVGPATEYNTSFVGQPYAKVEPIVPKAELDWSSGKFDSGTTTKSDYVSYPFEAPHRHKPAEWVKPNGAIEFSTSYGEEFTPRPLEKIGIIRPNMALRNLDVKFRGEPTYSSDFREWKLPDRPPQRFKKIEYTPNNLPFDAHPSYSTDYIPRSIEKVEPFKPMNSGVGLLGNQRVELSTDYKDSFKEYPISPRTAVKQDSAIKLPHVPLESQTTTKQDFQPQPLCKTNPIVPKGELKNADEPMKSSTTTKDDYVQWPVEPYSQKWTRPKWQRSQEKVDYSTSHADEFKPYDIQPIKRIRPPSRNRKLEAKFAGETSYSQEYPRWSSQERTKPIIHEHIVNTAEPFTAFSTYSTTFIPHDFEKPERVKKDNRSTVFPTIPKRNTVSVK